MLHVISTLNKNVAFGNAIRSRRASASLYFFFGEAINAKYYRPHKSSERVLYAVGKTQAYLSSYGMDVRCCETKRYTHDSISLQ